MSTDTQRIRLDINNVLLAGGDYGLSEVEIDAAAERARAAVAAIAQRRAGGDLGWMELPYADPSSIEEMADDLRARFDNFVVLGIGGSALGNIAVQTALNHPFYNALPNRRGPRFFVLDNSDPELNTGLLDVVDPARTVFNVITKSGSTGETLASFLHFRDAVARAVGEERVKDHFVMTTDPEKGPLREMVQREGFASLPVPAGVGGRFSVLSPVGLLGAAVSGVDIRNLLGGAAYADELCRAEDVWRNPAAMNALIQVLLLDKGLDMVVMMPYAQRLRDVADWFRQLWAESLGKRVDRTGEVVNVGPTPIRALGATDQHSQVQLYVEGPNNKVFNFMRIERFATEGKLPPAYEDVDAISYLGGWSFQELIKAEQEATALALTSVGKPNVTHILPEVNAFTLGQLFYMLEVQTAIAGELLNIDAFDQPGVEAGKIATYALLGRSGYEQQRAEIDALKGQRNPRALI